MRSSWEALAPGIEQELSTAVACRPPWEQRPPCSCVCVFVCSRLHGMAHVHVSHVRALCRVAVVVRVVLIEICVHTGFMRGQGRTMLLLRAWMAIAHVIL